MSFAANPRHSDNPPRDPPTEHAGPIASDSLAADSIRADGAFASNPGATPLGVQASHSTLATTDSSGATVLHASADGATREKEDARGAGPDERGVAGVRYPEGAGEVEFTGAHGEYGYVGGPGRGGGVDTDTGVAAGRSDFGATKLGLSAEREEEVSGEIRSSAAGAGAGDSGFGEGVRGSGDGEGVGAATGTGVRPYVDAAPTYTQVSNREAYSDGTFKPKGANLEDAGVTGSMPQTKTFTGNVGGVNDPGRLAEKSFGARDGDAVTEGARQGLGVGNAAGGTTDGGQYEALSSERV